MADVVIGLGHANVELGIRGDMEAFACRRLLPLIAAVELVLAGAAHAFHDFCGSGAKSQGRGQNHADRLLGAVSQSEAVADALAVKVNIGLGGEADVVDGCSGHGRSTLSVVEGQNL